MEQTQILLEILEELKLLTVNTKAEALLRFQDEFLKTELQTTMYASFDGERTLQEISDDIGCKKNTIQILAQKLVENDLVDIIPKGNSRIIKKSVSKIAIYYANKKLRDVSNG